MRSRNVGVCASLLGQVRMKGLFGVGTRTRRLGGVPLQIRSSRIPALLFVVHAVSCGERLAQYIDTYNAFKTLASSIPSSAVYSNG